MSAAGDGLTEPLLNVFESYIVHSSQYFSEAANSPTDCHLLRRDSPTG